MKDFGRQHWVMLISMSLLAIALIFALGFLLSWFADKVAVGAAAATSVACPVSKLARPLPGRTSFNFGNARIAVALPPGTTFAAIPDGAPGGANAFLQEDGWIRTKLGWFAKAGPPRVTGHPFGRLRPQLRSDVGPLSATSSGVFYPSLLYFPAFGCWKISARAGGDRLEAVVRVVRK
jgi:hypothetical protein